MQLKDLEQLVQAWKPQSCGAGWGNSQPVNTLWILLVLVEKVQIYLLQLFCVCGWLVGWWIA